MLRARRLLYLARIIRAAIGVVIVIGVGVAAYCALLERYELMAIALAVLIVDVVLFYAQCLLINQLRGIRYTGPW